VQHTRLARRELNETVPAPFVRYIAEPRAEDKSPELDRSIQVACDDGDVIHAGRQARSGRAVVFHRLHQSTRTMF